MSGLPQKTKKKSRKSSKARKESPWAVWVIFGAIAVIGGTIHWEQSHAQPAAPTPPAGIPQTVAVAPAAQPMASAPVANVAVANPPTSSAWPPPAGMPRDKLFGDHPGETVVPASAATAGNPYRRRFCDPWFRLSNLRLLPGAFPNTPGQFQKMAVDVEVVTPPAHPSSVHFELYVANDPTGRPRSASFSLHPGSVDLASVIRSGKGTATIQISPFGAKGPEAFSNLEVFLVTSAPGYRFERKVVQPGNRATWTSDAPFKVSPSLLVGTVRNPHPPRDWTAEEITALLGPPGEFSFTFE